jgi:hypothetical protein
MQQSWKHKNLRQTSSPAIKETSVSSSIAMSDLCQNFAISYNPIFGLETTLDGGRNRHEQQI